MKKESGRPFSYSEVTFKYPKSDRKPPKKGTVEAATRAVFHSFKPVPYATRIELIKFDDTKEKHIRFAYMRRLNHKWVKGKWRKRKWIKPHWIKRRWSYASQTTWTFSVSITRTAVREAEKAGLLD